MSSTNPTLLLLQAYSVRVGNDVRRRLLELEKGVCTMCKLDTKELYDRLRALDSRDDRRAALLKTPFRNLPPARIGSIVQTPKFGALWQADHIVAVSEGGGECDLSNFRTLCTVCHAKVTAGQRTGVNVRKLSAAAQGTKDIRKFFGT